MKEDLRFIPDFYLDESAGVGQSPPRSRSNSFDSTSSDSSYLSLSSLSDSDYSYSPLSSRTCSPAPVSALKVRSPATSPAPKPKKYVRFKDRVSIVTFDNREPSASSRTYSFQSGHLEAPVPKEPVYYSDDESPVDYKRQRRQPATEHESRHEEAILLGLGRAGASSKVRGQEPQRRSPSSSHSPALTQASFLAQPWPKPPSSLQPNIAPLTYLPSITSRFNFAPMRLPVDLAPATTPKQPLQQRHRTSHSHSSRYAYQPMLSPVHEARRGGAQYFDDWQVPVSKKLPCTNHQQQQRGEEGRVKSRGWGGAYS